MFDYLYDYLLITSKKKSPKNLIKSRLLELPQIARGGFEPSTLRV